VQRIPATPGSALVLGVVLIAVGLATLVLQRTGVDVSQSLGGSGWTLYVIVPGLGLLLAAALSTTGGWAQGLTVAGAILTTVGLTLLYQDQADHYASWAYAWTLIPISVGTAFVAHGWRVGRPDLVARGTRIAAIFGAIFVVGWLYFEATFRDGRAPFEMGENWPLVIIGIGVIVILLSLFRPDRRQAGKPE
jgi:hypothetical protein